MKKTTVKDIAEKKGAEKIAVITAYDAIFARLADLARIDAILVGDSLGNTLMGYDSTVPVEMADMLRHTAMVARAKPSALVIADVPFAVAHKSFDSVLEGCASLLRAGADCVKIEGGALLADTIKRLVDAGVPVMGHIGLMPQQILKLGSYKTFGRGEAEKISLIEDAKKLEEAGVFSIVVEKTDAGAAREITQSISIPTIGIGSGSDCDGQVLVSFDVLGLGERIPPFAKKYADIAEIAKGAFEQYVKDVKEQKFPE
ncbi:MAG: 3-methyl-2-oxobutanoate hydroxymethyltransferase [Opitutales bacterium]|nr:3-methyl-2-oxobutanoate hydroxymethyltransferase [Opitutales bacterium]